MANTSQSQYNATTGDQWRFGLASDASDARPLFNTQDHTYLLPRNTITDDDDMNELEAANFGTDTPGDIYSSIPGSIALGHLPNFPALIPSDVPPAAAPIAAASVPDPNVSVEPEPEADANYVYQEALARAFRRDAAESKFVMEAEIRCAETFFAGGDSSDPRVPAEVLPVGVTDVEVVGIQEAGKARMADLYFNKVEPAMDKVIVAFYKKNLHPDHLLPANLRGVSQYMLANGFGIHAMPTPPSGAQSAGLHSMPDRVEDPVRYSTITNPQGLRMAVSHFESSLVREVLIAAITVFLTECPHLRTLFGPKRRIPRSSLAMPALRIDIHWKSGESGYFSARIVDDLAIERWGSILWLLDHLRYTGKEARDLAKRMEDITAVMFVQPLPFLDRHVYAKVPYYAPRSVRVRQVNPTDHPHRFSPYQVPAVPSGESPAPPPFVRLTGPGMSGLGMGAGPGPGGRMPVLIDGTHPSYFASSTISRGRDRAGTVVASSSNASRGQ